jgi:hypothetical protein
LKRKRSNNWQKRLKNYVNGVDEEYRKLQVTGCRVQVASYKLQVTSFRVQVTGCKLQVAGYKLRVSSFRVQVTGYRLQVA